MINFPNRSITIKLQGGIKYYEMICFGYKMETVMQILEKYLCENAPNEVFPQISKKKLIQNFEILW